MSIQIVPFDPVYAHQMLLVARQIHAGSVYADFPLDEAKLLRQLGAAEALAPDRWFRIAVDDETDEVLGAFYGCIFPTFFNQMVIAKDMGQWTRRDGKQRNAWALLVSAFCDWARSKGAHKLGLGYSLQEADNIEVMRRVAETQGFRVVGYNLLKDL
jgi:hypothetical protein